MTDPFSMEILCLLTFILFLRCFVNAKDNKIECNPQTKYRSADGSCNNLEHPTWGMAETTQRRFIDQNGQPMVDFSDGKNLPRGYPDQLPNPREVTDTVSDSGNNDKFDPLRTVQHMAFGQLLAHDIIETKIPSGINCCDEFAYLNNLDTCFPIYTPATDKDLPSTCLNFTRSEASSLTDTASDFRENINLISSYIDGTFLYGDSAETMKSLRVKNSFLMKTDPHNLLPTTDGGSCLKLQTDNRCPFAGDRRVAAAPNLGLNHLLYLREHNRLSALLHQLNPRWTNEKVFQETRKIVIAQFQHVTYNHYLPLVVDQHTMIKFDLYSNNSGFNNVYDNKVDASILNAFGTACWRFGHSQIPAEQSQLSDDFNLKNRVVHLVEDNLESPNLWQQNSGENVESLTRWLAVAHALKIDSFLVDGIRNKLFFISKPPGSDLFSLNIQRGRDHGTPGFNRWREFCGLPKYSNFSSFGNLGAKMSKLYKNIDDVDFFIGGLMEKGENGGVGPTFSFIIGDQFHKLKTGDRFWYETDQENLRFTEEQLNSIKTKTYLSKIWCENFQLEEVQRDIFRPSSKDNPIIRCEDIPEINLDLWKDQ